MEVEDDVAGAAPDVITVLSNMETDVEYTIAEGEQAALADDEARLADVHP